MRTWPAAITPTTSVASPPPARAGEIAACHTEVLQEILYGYPGLRRLDLAREVYELFVQPCQRVFPVALADTDRARDRYFAAGLGSMSAAFASST